MVARLLFYQGPPDSSCPAPSHSGPPTGEDASQPDGPEEDPQDQAMEEGGEASPAGGQEPPPQEGNGEGPDGDEAPAEGQEEEGDDDLGKWLTSGHRGDVARCFQLVKWLCNSTRGTQPLLNPPRLLICTSGRWIRQMRLANPVGPSVLPGFWRSSFAERRFTATHRRGGG